MNRFRRVAMRAQSVGPRAGRAADDPGWSFAAIINDFATTKDEQGRPVYENRAPAVVKEGIPMVMRRCGYPDERKGKMMNVSALAQITGCLDETLGDIAAFHAALPNEEPTWARFAMALCDQLGQPARRVLEDRDEDPVLPTRMSVGYKVAAGYLVPTREILLLEFDGAAPPATVPALLEYVKRRTSLVGAREVCAAPMTMVTRVSEAFMMGMGGAYGEVSPTRMAMAQTLCRQLLVGLLWKRFDLVFERKLLFEDCPASALNPRTAHISKQLIQRREELADSTFAEHPRVPSLFDAVHASRLNEAFSRASHPDVPWPALEDMVAELVRHQDGAITLQQDNCTALVGQRFSTYLRAFREFVEVFEELERGLRQELGFPIESAVVRDPTFFPEPRALRWLELITGHRLRNGHGEHASWVFRNQHRTITLPPLPMLTHA